MRDERKLRSPCTGSFVRCWLKTCASSPYASIAHLFAPFSNSHRLCHNRGVLPHNHAKRKAHRAAPDVHGKCTFGPKRLKPISMVACVDCHRSSGAPFKMQHVS